MIYPSIDEITKGNYNRYTLCIATAKCARIVTDEYVEQREIAEKMLANKETDKSIASMIKREIRDEKAVKTAIKRLYQGEFLIRESSDASAPAPEACTEAAEAAEALVAEEIIAEEITGEENSEAAEATEEPEA